MKAALWIGLAAALVIGLVLAISIGERSGELTGPGAVGSDESSLSGVNAPLGTSDSAAVLPTGPDAESVNTAQDADEDSPRRVFGTLPEHKAFVTTDVIDPATLPHEPKVGLKDPDAVPNRREESAAATIHPMFTPSAETGIVDNDGPLGGQIPQPNPNVPGPDGQTVSPGEAPPTDLPAVVSRRVDFDASGPGQPVDPAEAAAAPPNYVLPGSDVEIEDPDLSTPP